MNLSRSPSPQARARRAKQTLTAAAQSIGQISVDSSIFVMTFGEYSLLDAVLHAANCAGKCYVTVWTWTISEYEIKALHESENITGATLFIDADSKTRVRNNIGFSNQWRDAFGIESIRYIINHAKMVTLESATHKILIRGSANANQNNKLEQLDITAGGPEFDMIRRIESEIPASPDDNSASAYAASKCGSTIRSDEMPFSRGIKPWAK